MPNEVIAQLIQQQKQDEHHSVQEKENDVIYWKTRWLLNQTRWQLDHVHPHLEKYVQLLLATEGGAGCQSATGKKVLIPLCGKTKDIAFLLSLGFQVFGIECTQQAIEELNEENEFGLQLNVAESIYESPDKQLQIYYGNIFECPIEKWGPFNCVWDRSAFIDLEYGSRVKYVEVIRRSLVDSQKKGSNFRYLLETFKYDESLFDGPPTSADGQNIEKYFGDWVKIKLLDTRELEEDDSIRKSMHGIPCQCMTFLLEPKSV